MQNTSYRSAATRWRVLAGAMALSGGMLASCSQPRAQTARPPSPPEVTIPAPAAHADAPADLAGLHNVVAYSNGLLSGSVPEGVEGFQTLRRMGVRTVISVDGAAPDVAAATAAGLRYIHLPIGYNGMDEARTLQIARAIEDARASDPDGPVYLHCHHGKHRSAGALGAAAVTLGALTPEQATARMKVSGTNPNYTGLYRCVAVARPATREQLAAVDANFPSVWRTTGMVHTMVEIDEVNDLLKLIEKAGWKAPANHPDLVPAAEAGRLADLMRVLTDDDSTRRRPAEFSQWLLDSSAKAAVLEEGLAAPEAGRPTIEELSRRFKVIAATCTQCHAKYRDEPGLPM